MLFNLISDAQYVINMGTTTLNGIQLFFCDPDQKMWRKSVICIRNVPTNLTNDEIALHFENRKKWGHELDVKQISRDKAKWIAHVFYNSTQGGRSKLSVTF